MGIPLGLLALDSRIEHVDPWAYAVAVAAGVVSFLSPCVLPLLPAYLSTVTGLDVAALQDDPAGRRRQILLTTAGFVAGFGTVFVAWGMSATWLGRSVVRNQELLTRVTGTFMLALGLFLVGSVFLRAPWLYQERRFRPRPGRWGAAAPYVLGMAFGFGWSPCIGPILGSILGIAANQDRLLAGATLLAAYTLGLGIPFLLAGLALGRIGGALDWVKRHSPALVVVSGTVIAAFGVVLMLDQLSRVTSELQQLLDRVGLDWVSDLSGI